MPNTPAMIQAGAIVLVAAIVMGPERLARSAREIGKFVSNVNDIEKIHTSRNIAQRYGDRTYYRFRQRLRQRHSLRHDRCRL